MNGQDLTLSFYCVDLLANLYHSMPHKRSGFSTYHEFTLTLACIMEMCVMHIRCCSSKNYQVASGGRAMEAAVKKDERVRTLKSRCTFCGSCDLSDMTCF
jgi:hypothetical protein